MTFATLLSTLAMALGLGGILPQLLKMVRTRSAGGQAPLGWGMALSGQLAMAYVNSVAFHSLILTSYNLAASTLCGVAIVLIAIHGRKPEQTAPAFALDDMATTEFAALREAVIARETRQRTCRSQPARREHGRGRTTRAVGRTSHA